MEDFAGGPLSSGHEARSVDVDPTCTRSSIDSNLGAKTVKKPVDFNHGRR
jgi:hypothetical protein